jgi:hypothetical protein
LEGQTVQIQRIDVQRYALTQVVAPHLLHCWSFLSPELRKEAAMVAQDLAVEAARHLASVVTTYD